MLIESRVHAMLAAALVVGLSACGGGPSGRGGIGTPTPDTSAVERNIAYAPSGQKLDLCRPADKSERRTAIIFIHGGGFKSGQRQDMEGYCKLYANGGFTAVTISYRLSGEAAYPAAVDDVDAAISWMKARAAQEGFDPGRIVLVGYSAGGSLALMGGRKAQDDVAARVSVAGVSDFQAAIEGATLPGLKRDLQVFLGRADARAVSPTSLTRAGDPPIFLFHGDSDKLVPVGQSVAMAEAAKAHDVKVLLRVFESAGHEIMLPNPKLEQLLTEMTAFLVAVDETP